MNVKEKYKKRDRVIAILSNNGKFRVVLTKNTEVARVAQQRHELTKNAISLLARAMSAASLMASMLKGEERIALELQPDDDIKIVFAEALQVGEIRGYVKHGKSSGTDKGFFKVSKTVYGRYRPMVGIVEVKNRDVTSEFNHYLNQSEQIPSVTSLDVVFDDDGMVKQSLGIMVQALPGGTLQEVSQIHQQINSQGPVIEMLTSSTLEEVVTKVVPFDFKITNNTPLDFYCRCSLDRFKKVLLSLDLREIEDMQQQDQNELICEYCNEHYYLTKQDFNSLIQQLKAKLN